MTIHNLLGWATNKTCLINGSNISKSGGVTESTHTDFNTEAYIFIIDTCAFTTVTSRAQSTERNVLVKLTSRMNKSLMSND